MHKMEQGTIRTGQKNDAGLILGIDASNSFSGGVHGYVKNLLAAADPQKFGFKKVIVWGHSKIINAIADRPWLEKRNPALLNKNVVYRKYFQSFKLEKEVKKAGCDILFSTGGIYKGSYKPFVIVHHNMLAYEKTERARADFFSLFRFKMWMLLKNQLATFRNSTSIIFTSTYAQSYVHKHYAGIDPIPFTTIPNGIRDTFSMEVKQQKPIEAYSMDKPFRLLFVSTIHIFKHQHILVEAVARLRAANYPIRLDLIGGIFNKKSANKMYASLEKNDPQGNFTSYKGYIEDFQDFVNHYKNADAFMFSSSCENMPTVLIEYMTAGRPIASSDMGPMPEILRDAGFYYDPLSVESTMESIKELLNNTQKRQEVAEKAKTYSKQYTWQRTANETFGHLSEVALSFKSK